MASRTTKTIRSGAIGFVAGVAALGVVATAQPLHSAVSTAVAGETHDAARSGADRAKPSQELWTPPQAEQQDDWLAPEQQPQDQWQIPQDQSQQQPYVQPAPQRAPQSQAS